MMICSYKQSCHLIECDDTRIFYAIHKVKSYGCGIEEAGLLCGHTRVSVGHPDKTPISCDQQIFAAILNRLKYLFDLSKSLSDHQGINCHPILIFFTLCNSCNLSYCDTEGRLMRHDIRSLSTKTSRLGFDFLMQQAEPGEVYVFLLTCIEPLLNFPVLATIASHVLEKFRQLRVTLKQSILSKSTVLKTEILKFVSKYDIIRQLNLGAPEGHVQYKPGFRQ